MFWIFFFFYLSSFIESKFCWFLMSGQAKQKKKESKKQTDLFIRSIYSLISFCFCFCWFSFCIIDSGFFSWKKREKWKKFSLLFFFICFSMMIIMIRMFLFYFVCQFTLFLLLFFVVVVVIILINDYHGPTTTTTTTTLFLIWMNESMKISLSGNEINFVSCFCFPEHPGSRQ